MPKISMIAAGESEFDHFVARELQRFLERLSGAWLEVVPASRTPAWKQAPNLLVVGEPGSHAVIREAVDRKQLTSEGLAEDGYPLCRIAVEGKPALVLGGSGEAAPLYAAYDLLERLGRVYLLTRDIAPSGARSCRSAGAWNGCARP